MFRVSLTGFASVCVPSVEDARSLLAQFPGFTIGREVNRVAMIYAAGREVGQIRDESATDHQDIVLGDLDLASQIDQAGDFQRVQATEKTYSVRLIPSGRIVRTRVNASEARAYAESYTSHGDERAELVEEAPFVDLVGGAPAELQPRPKEVQAEEKARQARERRHDGATGLQAEKADALAAELAGLCVDVEFSPRAFLKGDEERESLGHLFSASVELADGEGSTMYIWMDDREPASLRQQIAAGLREAAEELQTKAREIDPNGSGARAAA